MLRITCISGQKSLALKLEGKLAGPWVDELEKTWHSIQQTAGDQALIVDLNDVTLIDRAGEKLLRQMHAADVVLLAEGPYISGTLLRITGDIPPS